MRSNEIEDDSIDFSGSRSLLFALYCVEWIEKFSYRAMSYDKIPNC